MARFSDPVQLDASTEFSHARELEDPAFLVELLKQQFDVWRILERASRDLESPYGPKSRKGSWALAYFHFRCSKKDDVEPWYGDVHRRADLWRLFGFDCIPKYLTVWERFARLEGMEGAFEEAAHRLIQRAKSVDPNIGVHVSVDGTPSETHAYLFHACPKGTCKRGMKRLSTSDAIERKHSGTLADIEDIAEELDIDLEAEMLAELSAEKNVSPETASQEEANKPPVAAGETAQPEPEDVARAIAEASDGGESYAFPWEKEERDGVRRFDPAENERRLVAALMRTVVKEREITRELGKFEKGPGKVFELDRGPGKRKLYRLERDNHTWLTFDKTAGLIFYEERGEFYHGYQNQKVVDHYLNGATLTSRIYNGSIAEHRLHKDLFEHTRRALFDRAREEDRLPETWTGDSAWAYRSVYKHNTTHGIASVFPRRASSGKVKHPDKEKFDRDAIPRCQGCGGPTSFVRFNKGNPNAEDPAERLPRLWAKCIFPTPACPSGEQTFSCNEDWRYLVALWANEELYHHLLTVHHNRREGIHNSTRSRYGVAAKNAQQRPKRMGLGWQQLGASAGMLAEWLSLCYLNGWLATSTRTYRRHLSPRNVARKGRRLQKNVMNSLARWSKRRAVEGLNEPYGERAAELFGERFRLPPSDRDGSVTRAGPPTRKRGRAKKNRK
jgi:hypothetical protein